MKLVKNNVTEEVKEVVIQDRNIVMKKINTCIDHIVNRDGLLKVLDENDLQEIEKGMVETHRATNSCGGKQQSQFMDFNLTISYETPYRNLRQILSTIERSRGALCESRIKLEKDYINLDEAEEKYHKWIECKISDKFKLRRLKIDILEYKSRIVNGVQYIEGALKKLYYLQAAYNDICRKHNIPENWNELDFEKEEEEYHMKTAFKQAFEDVGASGRISPGNQIYFVSIGINPMSAIMDINFYIQQENQRIQQMAKDGINPNLGIMSFYNFLDSVYKKYKGSSAISREYKGIRSDGIYDKALFKG